MTKETRQRQKTLSIVIVIVIFQFMADLKQSRIRTPDAWSADISKIKEVLALKGIFSEIKSVCVLTYQISGFKTNALISHQD